MNGKDILGIKDLSRTEIVDILTEADGMRALIDRGERTDDLRGKNIATLFYENSTRTRNSFELAAKNLGATTTSVGVATSSVQKGESLIDTGKTLDSIGMNAIVIRHPVAGAPRLLAQYVSACVVNAGDGMNEHPSQALLDVLTAKRHFGSLNGLKVAIIGDILHSRVARSDTLCFTKLGASVTVCAPYTLIPVGIESMGAAVETDIDRAIDGADIVMPLRIQRERMDKAYFPSIEEYHKYYGVTEARLAEANEDMIVMHPAPINREAEISGEVADGYNSVIYEQVKNGVAVRMALLKMLILGR